MFSDNELKAQKIWRIKMKQKTRRFLHNFFKIFIIFLIGTAVINIFLFGFIYFSHKDKLKDEAAVLKMPGQMVEVNGHDMHVIQDGNAESDITLVFLHSGDITDDSVALQPLFDELSDYKLVYVDRSGTGFSEVSEADRDIDTILEETRKALELSGVEAPFILVPTGTAGIEAVHWVNKYPDEVSSIIGINMNYPEMFKSITADEYCGFFEYLMVHFYSIGGQRLIDEIYPENTFGVYTETQMTMRRALISKAGYTKDMYNEDLVTVDNATKVAEAGWPNNAKMYLIYANPLMEPYVNDDQSVNSQYQSAIEQNSEVDYISAYNETIREYFSDKANVTIEEMSGPARLYTYDPVTLAEKIIGYIETEMLQ